MMRHFAAAIVFSACAASSGQVVVQVGGQITLTPVAGWERKHGGQPAGWPIIMEVTMTNVGKEPIGYWVGWGSDNYPGAQAFHVQVRYGEEAEWHDVKPTNGQFTMGSGITEQLKPGDSVTVPLAIPITKLGPVNLRIRPLQWHAPAPAVALVDVIDDQKLADARRSRVFVGAIEPSPRFWAHVAEQYADSVVVDALLRLIPVDNGPIVAGAAHVLARRKTLPDSAGDDLAAAIRRWIPQESRAGIGNLRGDLVFAAAKTRSESARKAILDLLNFPPDSRELWMAVAALAESEGDDDWLRRARAAIVTGQKASTGNADVTKHVNEAIRTLDARLNKRQP